MYILPFNFSSTSLGQRYTNQNANFAIITRGDKNTSVHMRSKSSTQVILNDILGLEASDVGLMITVYLSSQLP